MYICKLIILLNQQIKFHYDDFDTNRIYCRTDVLESVCFSYTNIRHWIPGCLATIWFHFCCSFSESSEYVLLNKHNELKSQFIICCEFVLVSKPSWITFNLSFIQNNIYLLGGKEHHLFTCSSTLSLPCFQGFWARDPCPSQTRGPRLKQQAKAVRRISRSRGGGGRRHVAGRAGVRSGQRGAGRDGRWRSSGERLKSDEKEHYWWHLGGTLTEKFALWTLSGLHSTVPSRPNPLHKKRGGMRKEEGARRAERQRGGRREEGYNGGMYILMLTQILVLKTLFLQNKDYATGVDKVGFFWYFV